jgi:glutamate:GABA antiporter
MSDPSSSKVASASTPASSSKAAGKAAASSSKAAGKAAISASQLAVLTVVAVASLRGLPSQAVYGMGSIALYVIPAVLFLIPTALVAAELAVWRGGVYTWVREALGNRWGFVAIWLQWIQNVVWYPVQLAFVAAGIAYIVSSPNLANSGLYTAVVILVAYWGSTMIALAGGNVFAKVGSWGGIIGTILPGALLIVLGGWWVLTKQPSQIPASEASAIPPFTGLASIVLIVSNFLSYAGMEVNAVHVNDMKNPRRYPVVILAAALLILAVFIVPTLVVALSVPPKELGLTTGIMKAFEIMFSRMGLGSWATIVVAVMIVVGALASVVTWIAGPSKGLLLAGRTGLLPPLLQKRNGKGVQAGILVMQGLIVTALAAIFLFSSNVSSGFFTLVDMAAALYLIMYMLMFASAIILRSKAPNAPRTYKVPAMWLVASVGFAASLAGFVFSFVPPSQVSGFPPAVYPWVVGAVVVVLGVPPLIFYALHKPAWRSISDAEFAQLVGDHATAPSKQEGSRPQHLS